MDIQTPEEAGMRQMMKRVGFMAGVMLAVGFAAPASAALLTFNFAGTLNAGNTIDGYGPGSPFTGSLSYNVPQAPIAACTNNCQYLPDAVSVSFGVDGLASPGGGTNRLRVQNNVGPGLDSFSLNLNAGIVDTIPNVTVTSMSMVLQDNQGTVFADASLPLSFPPLSDFEIRSITFNFMDNLGLPGTAVGTLSSFEIARAPEPGMLGLLGLGMIALALRRRRGVEAR